MRTEAAPPPCRPFYGSCGQGKLVLRGRVAWRRHFHGFRSRVFGALRSRRAFRPLTVRDVRLILSSGVVFAVVILSPSAVFTRSYMATECLVRALFLSSFVVTYAVALSIFLRCCLCCICCCFCLPAGSGYLSVLSLWLGDRGGPCGGCGFTSWGGVCAWSAARSASGCGGVREAPVGVCTGLAWVG